MGELEGVPTVVWWLIGLGLLVVVGTLIDLALHEVKHLPRLAWAAIIVLVSFPIGVVLYLTLGRVSGPREPQPAGQRRDRPPPDGSVRDASRKAAVDPVGSPGGILHTSQDGQGEAPDASAGVGTAAAMIVRTEGLSKRYRDTWALQDIDLRVPAGTTYGLIGPNGAGKTTLLSILAGLRHPTDGQLQLEVDRVEVAVVVDTPRFEPWLTAREVVDLARTLSAPHLDPERVDEVLGEVDLREAAHRRVGGFSRGMLQRLGLATGLVGRPKLLILDEPSSALDPAGRRDVLELIGAVSEHTTVILSTHALADVQQVCDVVGVIDDGTLRFQGPLSTLLAHTSTSYALHVRGDATALAAELERQPWCQQLTRVGADRIRLVVADANAAERDIPALVVAHDLGLVSFTPATDLEAAFLELTS